MTTPPRAHASRPAPRRRRPAWDCWRSLAATLLATLALIAAATPAASAPGPTAPTQASPSPAPAPAAVKSDAGPDLSLLAIERWREHSWGVSLRPPLGSNLVERTADDAVMRVIGDPGYRVSLFIRKSPDQPKLDQLTNKLIAKFAIEQPSAVITEQKEIKIADGRGAWVCMKVVDPKRKDWVVGYAVTQIDATVYVLLQLECSFNWFTTARPIFEAMVASIEIANPGEIDKAREEAVARGMQWRAGVKLADLQQAIISHQWFRIVQGEKDVGWMHVAQKPDKEMQSSGIRVDVEATIMLEKETYTTTGRHFLADNGAMEVWSTRTVGRKNLPPGAKAGPDDERVVSETGVRNKQSVEVNRANAAQNRGQAKWDLSKRGIMEGNGEAKHSMGQAYLSQVELHLLPRLLPRKTAEPMGFYAYYPNTGKLAYRTERVVVEADGSYKVISRPTPEQPEQVSIYNAGGALIKRSSPGGQTLLPATKAEIAAKWGLK